MAVTVYKLAGGRYAPLPGAKVDVWHCDAAGVYSDEDHEMNLERTGGQKWLRGFQTTDAKGLVGFKTIVPGCYPGRTTHIHFKVRQGGREFASQWFFDDTLMDKVFAKAPYQSRGSRDARNSSDGIFRERQAGGMVAGDHLTLALSPAKEGYKASFAIALTEENLRGRH